MNWNASRCTRLATVLFLPLVALAYSWAATYRLAQQGQEWLVPIQGYDPRDLLRGHYVQYRYDWPSNASPSDVHDSGAAPFNPSFAGPLCIEGTAPNIAKVRAMSLALGRLNPRETKGCAIIVRAAFGARREVQGLDTGILFVSQARGLALSRRLADPNQQGFIRVRIRPDGVMRPVDLEFRPRRNN